MNTVMPLDLKKWVLSDASTSTAAAVDSNDAPAIVFFRGEVAFIGVEGPLSLLKEIEAAAILDGRASRRRDKLLSIYFSFLYFALEIKFLHSRN